MEFHPRINMRSFIREQHQLEAQETPPSSSPAAAAAAVEQREHMFEKVVTPSDVGKLNRLVIPKQHAERYFPLDPASDDSKGGLLLNFEEGPTGRPWRFRYSYWNSSQSYVMTKGWSRFVKDKRLDAGDTVSFSRAVANSNRLFIDWRRRPPLVVPPQMVPTWPSTWTTVMPPPYFRHVPVVGQHVRVVDHGILESVPVLTPRRHVRLFGVNLECEEEEEEQQQQPPSAELPMQWGMSAVVGTPARSYSELQLMPPTTTEEAGRS